jgi:GMP synthase (glutamine-hydrolysing)
MGGPMSIHDEEKFPWLKEEKKFIKKAIEENKKVIGICLGSQLIASVLGAMVYPNAEKEIGWFDVHRVKESYQTDLLSGFYEKLKVFHWHGDTFELPPKSVHLFQSEICKNQGFLFGRNVLGLQFHFEINEKGLEEILADENETIDKGTFVQTRSEIMAQKSTLNLITKGCFCC